MTPKRNTAERFRAATPTCSITPLPSVGGERRSYAGHAAPFKPHSHGCFVIGRIIHGERLLIVNGSKVLIGPGDAIAFNPGDVHGCVSASAAPFIYDSVTVAPDILPGVHLKPLVHADAVLQALFSDLVDSVDAGAGERVRDDVLALAGRLEQEPAAPRDPAGSALWVHDQLRARLAEPVSVRGLAREAGMADYALIRAYERQYAITPMRHLAAMRAERACELLAGGAPPADAAVRSGFSDQSHLTRVLKGVMGFTPGAYQKMMLS